MNKPGIRWFIYHRTINKTEAGTTFLQYANQTLGIQSISGRIRNLARKGATRPDKMEEWLLDRKRDCGGVPVGLISFLLPLLRSLPKLLPLPGKIYIAIVEAVGVLDGPDLL